MKQALYLTLIIFSMFSCKKQDDFLNTKSQLNQVMPSTLQDFQGLLDDHFVMNAEYPGIGLASSDNYYSPDASFASLPSFLRNIYTWQTDVFEGQPSSDWNFPYTVVEHANVVLDGLVNISVSAADQASYNNIKGSALFFRTLAFYGLAQDFCKAYDSATAGSDLGIVLRLTSDVNQKSVRATVQQTYQQMINDLKQAIPLLPVTPAYQMRPSQPAANGFLAKIYISMGDYGDAAVYATSSLNQFNTLLDFNSSLVNTSPNAVPFPAYPKNPEVSFYSYTTGDPITLTFAFDPFSNVDSLLYKSYDTNDLRRSIFYQANSSGTYTFCGSYSGTYYNFNGIATNEIYLIRAESYARRGNISGALADMNTLLNKRYSAGTYIPVSISDPQALLSFILKERRKELPFTAQLRWEDLRRLNKDPKFAITLTRVLGGTSYSLPPNDPRYVLPIPDNEIQISNIQQNPR